MYAAVDIGGTKTLLAAIDNNGVILQKIRFETPKDYDLFVLSLKRAAKQLADEGYHDFKAGGIGAPGWLDRKHGVGIGFGNLPWKNVAIDHDVEKILHCPMVFENDAKMAALSEAMLVKEKYDRVLYVTVSTGIGYGLVVNQILDSELSDRGGKNILVEHHGKLEVWESFASGHAIVERYGKRAEDIHDEATWKKIVRDLTPGLLELIAITDPQLIVIGGSVGTYFDRYGKLLREEIASYHLPVKPLPHFAGAKRPEEAVLFGCYDLAKQQFGGKHASAR